MESSLRSVEAVQAKWVAKTSDNPKAHCLKKMLRNMKNMAPPTNMEETAQWLLGAKPAGNRIQVAPSLLHFD